MSNSSAESRDRGSVLLMTLVLVIVGGLIVTGLLSYVATVIRVRPPLEERNAGFEAARSGIRMAIALQRATGADECFSDGPFVQAIDGRTVTVTCSTTDTALSGLGRFALVSTANVGLRDGVSNISGSTSAGAWDKPIRGPIFVNGGSLDQRTSDVIADVPPESPTQLVLSSLELAPNQPRSRYLLDAALVTEPPDLEEDDPDGDGDGDEQPVDPRVVGCDDPLLFVPPHYGGSPTVDCVDVGWIERVGDRPEDSDTWQYPQLPQVPSFVRPGSQAQVGSCSIYFPGRYNAPLVLDGGRHYFASGIYVFNAPLTIRGNADVVAGEGRYRGCSFDADAAFSPTAPRSHEITGKGATFVFGDEGRLEIDRSSLRINRRIATVSTRASDGVAIVTANAAIDTDEVTVPESQVLGADGDSVPMSTHSVVPNVGQPAVTYRPSTLEPTDLAVDARIAGGDRFLVEGYVFTPSAGVRVSSANNDGYDLRLNGGVVATTIELDVQRSPPPSSRFLIGVEQEVVKRQVRLVAAAGSWRSTAFFEIHRDGSYAINSWTLNE